MVGPRHDGRRARRPGDPRECDQAEPPDAWTIYPGAASGFSSQARSWARADTHGEPERYLSMGCPSCGHEVRDFDGDGWPDLMVTARPDDPTVGTDHWEVYALECEEA
ncbi:MAG: hypothetical protein H6712_22455 [Myxococcales bacterium]|nr:hypothetical protein [Myxococcales bacterium]MCB9716638.1 hypothetical protein [Myxococcales bacterium]